MVQRDGLLQRAAFRRLTLAAVFALAAAGRFAQSQTYTDAIAREFTVVRVSAAADAIAREFTVVGVSAAADAIAREFTAVQTVHLLSPPESVSREISAFNELTVLRVASSTAARAWPVSGTLPQQVAVLNAAPPAFDPNTWLPVHRQNLNLDDEFLCGGVSDPLARSYVSADTYIDNFDVAADEVTFDNCGSAFYAFPFTLPEDAVLSTARLTGSANVDDQGVVWLNTTRLSALMTAPGCTPLDPTDPLDPCYLQQDAGRDRVDSQARRVLTWPTLDPFERPGPGAFVAGQNVLIFAVVGDAQAFEPTGVEFAAAVIYFKRGDVNCDGVVTFDDIDPFVSALSGPSAYNSAYPHCNWLTADMDCDATVSFDDIDFFVACLTGNCSCPAQP